MKQHLSTVHGGASANSDVESNMKTEIQCRLCDSNLTPDSVGVHLKNVHFVEDSNWESYIAEAECHLEMKLEDNSTDRCIGPTASPISLLNNVVENQSDL